MCSLFFLVFHVLMCLCIKQCTPPTITRPFNITFRLLTKTYLATELVFRRLGDYTRTLLLVKNPPLYAYHISSVPRYLLEKKQMPPSFSSTTRRDVKKLVINYRRPRWKRKSWKLGIFEGRRKKN